MPCLKHAEKVLQAEMPGQQPLVHNARTVVTLYQVIPSSSEQSLVVDCATHLDDVTQTAAKCTGLIVVTHRCDTS